MNIFKTIQQAAWKFHTQGGERWTFKTIRQPSWRFQTIAQGVIIDPTNWILLTGSWDDDGVWLDNDQWKDS
jgi:hypothetical protein